MKKTDLTQNLNNNRKNKMTGILRANPRGYAFITPDDGGDDFFVPKKSLNGAFHGDKVLFLRVSGTRDEALILNVVERNPSKLVGTLILNRRQAKVYPDDRRRPVACIPFNLLNGAKNGQKVVCEITRYFKGKLPSGKISEVLGEEGDLIAEELSIIRAYELRESFPCKAVSEAREVCVEKPVLKNRRDLRDRKIFTIDGADARDLDDGVSIEKTDGNYVLGVHIADVSHYVKPGSELDCEAYARGTSIYFPDRVLPMLPTELSNGICSLNEGEERYAVSCQMTFDKDGNRINYEIFESVICSRHKMTYPDVTEICEGNAALREKYSDIAQEIDLMKELCLSLEKKRENAGSVTLDLVDAHIYVDENGEIIIPPAQRTISQRIIEQFMIAANEAVAEFMKAHKLPCLYRIHERPSPEKARKFFTFLKYLGLKVSCNAEETAPRDFQKILKSAEDKPFYAIINKVMLRSMQKARYSGENKGHFGLASECYCHFTSPIRRYPDLFVHRSLKYALRGESAEAKNLFSPVLGKAGTDTSERERVAEEAERSVDDLYKLAYMSERLGEVFEAVVSGVTPDSVYCELDNSIEGVIPLEDLPADNYEFIEDRYLLKGRKRKFGIGDKLKVRVISCDLGRMKTIMQVADY